MRNYGNTCKHDCMRMKTVNMQYCKLPSASKKKERIIIH